ncbi:riboflavin biosynthesis protein RibF [Salibacterium salarium]|uniref:Riboflavin biosynthesis protein n=2 Tax=Salibacterium salarium TaxID=284579 RepID=A0A3R9P7X7_9BACI|nr:riboflavin biosynthesis protein RibF [Salibacterium salarium]RSL33313.1 riboflavin biosynthesis protein RibF [Salibacterium salarium]
MYHQNEYKPSSFPEMVLALGFFDGVHVGHQEVIQTAKQIASEKGCAFGIMTFHPHPKVVLSPHVSETDMRYITPLYHKETELEKENPDYLFVVHFDSAFAKLEPQEFIDKYIIELQVKHVVAGFDFSYGRLGKGSMETLSFHARNQFSQTTVGEIQHNGKKISSTLIKNYIEMGQMNDVKMLLGRSYSTRGVVEHGEQRGRTIGFPTANIKLRHAYIMPAAGVYAVQIKVKDNWFDGVCNIGYKPTFHKDKPDEPIIEVYIFDFEEDIYGEETEVCFHAYIRPEEKFANVEELIKEMENDTQAAQNILRVLTES